MRRLIFIRHGETEYNLKNKGEPGQHVIAGQFDSPLTQFGETQAIQVGRSLSAMSLKLSRFLASDLGRAVRTAQLIVTEIGTDVRIEYSSVLRERFAGAFEGRKIAELKLEYPEYFTDPNKCKWRADFTQKAPGGENFTEVTNRIAHLLNELTADRDGDVIIITHIRVVCCAVGMLVGLSEAQTVALRIPHCEPLVVQLDASGRRCAVGLLADVIAKAG